MFFCVVLWPLFLWSLLLWQLPPRDRPKPAAGTATVSGRVADRETGQPLRWIRIEFRRQAIGEYAVVETETGVDGRYEITDLPAGEYRVTAAPAEYRTGYQPKTFQVDEPASFYLEPPLELKPGQVRRDIDFALARTYAIEGQVTNEQGDPLSDVSVYAEREGTGTTPLTGTDDRGHFRLFGVAPGSWRVCAHAGDDQGAERAVTGDILRTRFVTTCAPAAAPIRNSDIGGVSIVLQRQRAYTVSGYVIDSAGTAVSNAAVRLERVVKGNLRFGSEARVEVSGGMFVARGVTPGEYVLRAIVDEPWDPFVRRSPFAGPRQFGFATVQVDAADVRDLAIALREGTRIAGRVVFDGEPKPATAGQLGIYGGHAPDAPQVYREMNTLRAPVRQDLTFELERLHGPIVLSVSDAPSGWIVKSIRYAGAEIHGEATEFKDGPEARNIEVVLTNRTAALTARPVDKDGRPARAVILLAPAKPSRWRVRRIAPMSPGRDGYAIFSLLLPDDYLVAAVAADEIAAVVRDDDALARIAERAERLTLAAGDHPVMDVRVVTARQEP